MGRDRVVAPHTRLYGYATPMPWRLSCTPVRLLSVWQGKCTFSGP